MLKLMLMLLARRVHLELMLSLHLLGQLMVLLVQVLMLLVLVLAAELTQLLMLRRH